MTDKEKFKLIDKIIGDAWEFQTRNDDNSGFYEGVISAIYSVVLFGEEGDR